MTEETLNIDCTENEDGVIRCEVDLDDDEGEMNTEFSCHRDEDEMHCNIETIEASGSHADRIVSDPVEKLRQPEAEREFQAHRGDAEFREELAKENEFREEMVVDDE